MSCARYDVKCLMCSADMGRVVSGRFVPDPDLGPPGVPRPGLPPCGRCGGSGFLEPVDSRSSVFERAEFVLELAAARASRLGSPPPHAR